MNTWKYFVAFGVGVAAGAAVTLLYAPQTGNRTRRQLRRGWEDTADRLQSRAGDISDRMDDYGKQAERAIRRSRQAVDETLTRANSVAGKVARLM